MERFYRIVKAPYFSYLFIGLIFLQLNFYCLKALPNFPSVVTINEDYIGRGGGLQFSYREDKQAQSGEDADFVLPICCGMRTDDIITFQCHNSLSASSKETVFKKKTWTAPKHLVSTKVSTKFRFISGSVKCKRNTYTASLSLSPSSLHKGSHFAPDGYLKHENEYFRPDEYCISGLNKERIEVHICPVDCSDPMTPCIQKCCDRDQIYSFGYGNNPRGCVDTKRTKWFPTLYHNINKKLNSQEMIKLNPHIIHKFPTSFKYNCRYNKTTVFPHGKGIAGFLTSLTRKNFRNLPFRLRKDGWLLYPQQSDVKGSTESIVAAKSIKNYCIDGAQDYGESTEFSNLEGETILFLCSGGVDEAFDTKTQSGLGQSPGPVSSIAANPIKSKIPQRPTSSFTPQSTEGLSSLEKDSLEGASSSVETDSSSVETLNSLVGPEGEYKETSSGIKVVVPVQQKPEAEPYSPVQKPHFPIPEPYSHPHVQKPHFSIPESYSPVVRKPYFPIPESPVEKEKPNVLISKPYSPDEKPELANPQTEPPSPVPTVQEEVVVASAPLHPIPQPVSIMTKPNLAQIRRKKPAALSQTTFNHNNQGHESQNIQSFYNINNTNSRQTIPTCCNFSPDVNDGFTHHCRNRRMDILSSNGAGGGSVSYTPMWNVPSHFMTTDKDASFSLMSSPITCGPGKFQFQGFIHNFEQERAKSPGEKKHGILSDAFLKYDNEFYAPDEYCVNGLSPRIVEVLVCKPDCSMWETPCIQKCCGLDEIYNLGLGTGNRGCQPRNLDEPKFIPTLYQDMMTPANDEQMKNIHPHFVQKFPPTFQHTCYNKITLAFPFSREVASKLTPADSSERGGTAFKHLTFRFRKDGKLIYTYPESDGTSYDSVYDRGEYCVDAVRDYGVDEPFNNNENQTILFICASEPHSMET